jgi:hypothetical protein
MFIKQELCGVRTGNYDNFNWNQVLFKERIPKKYAKMIKVWHLVFRGSTLWTIWIERMTKCYNHEQWPESKVKQRIWDELIMYAKAAWKCVLELIKIINFPTATLMSKIIIEG